MTGIRSLDGLGSLRSVSALPGHDCRTELLEELPVIRRVPVLDDLALRVELEDVQPAAAKRAARSRQEAEIAAVRAGVDDACHHCFGCRPHAYDICPEVWELLAPPQQMRRELVGSELIVVLAKVRGVELAEDLHVTGRPGLGPVALHQLHARVVHLGEYAPAATRFEKSHLLVGGWNGVADSVVQHSTDAAANYLRYWVGEEAGKIFCRVDAPDVDAANAVHSEAHGLVGYEMHAEWA